MPAKLGMFARLRVHSRGGNMKDRAYESASSEDEVCCIIGQAVNASCFTGLPEKP